MVLPTLSSGFGPGVLLLVFYKCLGSDAGERITLLVSNCEYVFASRTRERERARCESEYRADLIRREEIHTRRVSNAFHEVCNSQNFHDHLYKVIREDRMPR
jgi:hypothetical protein